MPNPTPKASFNDTVHWILNGSLHRTDGPVYEGADGTRRWFVNGREISIPYSHVLTAAFARGLPIPEGAMLEIATATGRAQADGEHMGSLKTILHKHWPMEVKKILATLFIDTDPAIKNIALSLLGRQSQPDIASTGIAL